MIVSMVVITNPTCHGHSLTSVSTPPTILVLLWANPHLQSPEAPPAKSSSHFCQQPVLMQTRRKRKEKEGHRVTIVTRSLVWLDWSRVWDWSLRAISASKRHHDLKAQVVTRLIIWIFGHLVTFSAYKSYKLLHKILPVQVWWTWVFLWKFHMDIFFGPFQMWMCWLILCGWNVLVVICLHTK